MSLSNAAHGFLASQWWDFVLVSWRGAWGVGAVLVALKGCFMGIVLLSMIKLSQ